MLHFIYEIVPMTLFIESDRVIMLKIDVTNLVTVLVTVPLRLALCFQERPRLKYSTPDAKLGFGLWFISIHRSDGAWLCCPLTIEPKPCNYSLRFPIRSRFDKV
jgi:hypothetical protein